jgi:O-antigen ligase
LARAAVLPACAAWPRSTRPAEIRKPVLTTASAPSAPRAALLALWLVGLAWLLPFFSPNFQEPIGSFYGEIAAVVLGMLALCCLAAPSLWAGLVIPRTALVFLVFAGLILLHLLLGRFVYAQQSLLAVLYLLWALALAMLGWRLRELLGEERVVTTLAWFLLGGALLSAAIGLCQYWSIPSPLSPFMLPQIHGRIYANTGQPNHLANYLCLGLASLGYLLATRRIGFALAPAAMAPLLMVMGLSSSRSVWLYVPVLFLLAGAWHLGTRSDASRRLLVFCGLAVVGLVAAMYVPAPATSAAQPAPETMGARIGALGMGSAVRMREWYEAWLMFLDAPLAGIGLRQFAFQHFLLNAQLPPPRLYEGVVDNAHNLVMHTLAEFGLAGLCVLLAGLVAWVAALRRHAVTPQLWWILAVAGILGIHSMLEYPLWYAYFLGIAAVVIGVSERAALTAGSRSGGRLILFAVLALGWMALLNTYQDYRTLQSLHGVQKGTQPRNTAQVLLDLQQHSLFTPFVELALSRLMVLDRERLEDKLAFNGNVMRFSPAADVAYRQAVLLALAGRTEEARAQWDLARRNYPESAADVAALMRRLPASGEPGVAELIRHAQESEKLE